MSGNIALDIAIGLFFIYLLYSLLASIIVELFSSILGFRARNLQYSIQRMLEPSTDGWQPSGWTRIFKPLVDVFTDLAESFKNFGSSRNSMVRRFYSEPLIKYQAQNRVFSKPSYISPSDFSKVIMDLLAEGDGETRLERIKSSLKEREEGNSNGFDNETRKLLGSFLGDSNDDLEKFKAELEKWFNTTMNRSTGWYKRNNQFFLLIVGFLMAAWGNINSVEIVKTLSTDKAARDQMVQSAMAYVSENKDIIKYVEDKDGNNTIDSLSAKEFKDRLDSLQSIQRTLGEDMKLAKGILGITIPDSLKIVRADPKDELGLNQLCLPRLGNVVQFTSNYFMHETNKFYKEKEKGFFEYNNERDKRFWQFDKYYPNEDYVFFNRSAYFWDNFLGYLITALAISLGATFWFDILNKLIRLRGSVQTTSTDQSSTNQTSTNSKTTPVG